MFGKDETEDTHKKEGLMFGKDVKEGTQEVMGFIGKGMVIDGKMSFEGVVRVDGHFKGEVNTSGTLHVGGGALVEAKVNVDKAIVTGEVRGSINAASRVELQAPGKMFGDVRTPTLIVGEGVIFEGNCVMSKKDKPVELKKGPTELKAKEPTEPKAKEPVEPKPKAVDRDLY
jgi:cytoskeletal protein CcmA (bactofilin family)